MTKPRLRVTSKGYWRYWFTFLADCRPLVREIWVGPYDTLDAAYADACNLSPRKSTYYSQEFEGASEYPLKSALTFSPELF